MLLVIVTAIIFPVSTLAADANSPRPIPDDMTYGQFLLNDWNPGAPVIITFKDPFCPYCIRALKDIERLDDLNVFMFWSPILGQASISRVEEILHCQAPVGEQVIKAVIERQSPQCTKNKQTEVLAQLNHRMVEAYDPQAVPSYYFGGRRSSLAEISNLTSRVKQLSASTVTLDWARYDTLLLQQQSSQLARVVVVVPEDYPRSKDLIDTLLSHSRYQWYISSIDNYNLICSQLNNGCNQEKRQDFFQKSQEIQLLFGLEENRQPRLILGGRLLSDAQIAGLNIEY